MTSNELQKYLYDAAMQDWRNKKINDKQMVDVLMFLGWLNREIALKHLKERSVLEYKLGRIYALGTDDNGEIKL